MHLRVRVRQGAAILSEREVDSPEWLYTAAEQAADGVTPLDTVEVAQISARYGPGLYASVPMPA